MFSLAAGVEDDSDAQGMGKPRSKLKSRATPRAKLLKSVLPDPSHLHTFRKKISKALFGWMDPR